jgi:hypothetical protein
MPRPEFAQSTIYKDALTPSEKVRKKIVSVFPEPTYVPHHSGHRNIPGKGKGGRYAFIEVGPSVEQMDLGEGNNLALLSVSSDRTARDIIGLSDEGRDELTGKVLAPAVRDSDLFRQGLFVPEGDEPTEAELVAAEIRRETWMDLAILRGDRAWDVRNRLSDVPGEAILAARYRGITRPWFGATTGTRQERYQDGCPACGAELFTNKKVCGGPAAHLVGWEEGVAYWKDDPDRKRLAAIPMPPPPKPQATAPKKGLEDF